jgi:hypothetical protein
MVFENFFEAVGQSLSSMFLAFWDADSGSRIHAFVQAEVRASVKIALSVTFINFHVPCESFLPRVVSSLFKH